ncbi:MAG: hypothetical protein FVQ80_14385 [Planctomycetes bacterium]|nr:hypothetical protein [Planctomycetota bacterium]
MKKRFSAFNLHEYASGMLNDHIRVIEDPLAPTASCNLRRREITIPALDYSKPIEESQYRITKGYVDHESAHILFSPFRDGLSSFKPHLRRLVNLLEDMRIERLYSRKYRGIAEDLNHLNSLLFSRNMSRDIERDTINAMCSLIFSYGLRIIPPDGLHFLPTTQKLFNTKIRNFIDEFIDSDGLSVESYAQQIFDILKNTYSEKEQKSIPDKSASPHRSETDEAAGDSSSSSSTPKSTSESIKETEAAVTSSVDESTDTGPAEHVEQTVDSVNTLNPDLIESDPDDSKSKDLSDSKKPESTSPDESFMDELNEAFAAADIESFLESRIPDNPKPSDSHQTLAPYKDIVVSIKPSEIRSFLSDSGFFENTLKEHSAVISAYHSAFSNILLSTQKSRTLSTFEGRFNSKKAYKILTDTCPRIYTRTIPGRTNGYDVSILLDVSGSMGRLAGYNKNTKFYYSSQAMIVLAKAFTELPGINFEIIAFTADKYFNLKTGKTIFSGPNNVLYPLKSFDQKDMGIIPYFYDFAIRNNISYQNFDLAAVKVASKRLYSYPSANNKLLIVLSDGKPCCANNSSETLLAEYIKEVSTRHPIFGIGIDNRNIGRIYEHSINVNDMTTFKDAVLKRIKAFILSKVKTS